MKKKQILIRNSPEIGQLKPEILLFSPKLQIKKMHWIFHKGDNDYNPSVPHGHSKDNRFKLELWTGAVYNTLTNKKCGRASVKEMSELYNYPGFVEFVEECRREYISRNPGIHIAPLAGEKFPRTNKRNRVRFELFRKRKTTIPIQVNTNKAFTHLLQAPIPMKTPYRLDRTGINRSFQKYQTGRVTIGNTTIAPSSKGEFVFLITTTINV